MFDAMGQMNRRKMVFERVGAVVDSFRKLNVLKLIKGYLIAANSPDNPIVVTRGYANHGWQVGASRSWMGKGEGDLKLASSRNV